MPSVVINTAAGTTTGGAASPDRQYGSPKRTRDIDISKYRMVRGAQVDPADDEILVSSRRSDSHVYVVKALEKLDRDGLTSIRIRGLGKACTTVIEVAEIIKHTKPNLHKSMKIGVSEHTYLFSPISAAAQSTSSPTPASGERVAPEATKAQSPNVNTEEKPVRTNGPRSQSGGPRAGGSRAGGLKAGGKGAAGRAAGAARNSPALQAAVTAHSEDTDDNNVEVQRNVGYIVITLSLTPGMAQDAQGYCEPCSIEEMKERASIISATMPKSGARGRQQREPRLMRSGTSNSGDRVF